jgi:hypothetical protein
MHLIHRTVGLLSALLLSLASINLAAVPAGAAPSDPAAPPVSSTAEGTPHSVHTFEPAAFRANLEAGTPQGAASGLTRAGNIEVTLVTVKLADRTAQQTAAIDVNAAKAGITAASNYWKAMSNNRLSMSVASTRTGIPSAAKSVQSYHEIMSTVTRELGWINAPYKALVVVIPVTELSWGALGAGWSAGNQGGRILLPLPSNFTSNVVGHEFGHVLGLMHADSLQCLSGKLDVGADTNGNFTDSSCTVREYGDTMDIMGAARWFELPALSSSHWEIGGFGRGDEIRDAGIATGSKSYTLKAWAGTEANRAVKFTDPKSGEVYFLELRLPVGYDTRLAVDGNKGVKILQRGGATAVSSLLLMPSTVPFSGYYAKNHAWQAGSTFTTHSGTKVRIDYVSGTAAGVTITAPHPFTDISASSFQSDIIWMYDNKLSNGWVDGTYRPYESISREAMAAFMYRLAGSPAFTPPAGPPFVDVAGSAFYTQIAWLEAEGLANGWVDGTFRPKASMSREAMAAFLFRYSGEYCQLPATLGYSQPAVSPFKDVKVAPPFYGEISWTSHAGISKGWSDGTYRPAEPISREAMAAFIHRLDTHQDANGGCRPAE